MNRILAVAVAAAGLAAVAFFLFQDGEEEQAGDRRQQAAVPVVVAEATEDTAETRFEGVGSITARSQVDLSAEVGGRISSIAVADGTRVEKDERLLTLETQDEEAAVTAAEAALEQAKSEYERDRELFEEGYVAAERLSNSKSAFETAKAELASAKVALDNRSIKAPFSGEVSLIPVSEGDYVTPGDPLLTMVTPEHLEVDVGVPAELAPRLGDDARIIVQPEGSEPVEAPVVARDASAGRTSNLVTIRGALEVEPGFLQPGRTVPVSVVIDRRENAVFVPESALFFVGPQQYLYRVGEDDQADRVAVQVGQRRAGTVEIREGLEAGDRVIIEGLQKVEDGRKVSPQSREGQRTDDSKAGR